MLMGTAILILDSPLSKGNPVFNYIEESTVAITSSSSHPDLLKIKIVNLVFSPLPQCKTDVTAFQGKTTVLGIISGC